MVAYFNQRIMPKKIAEKKAPLKATKLPWWRVFGRGAIRFFEIFFKFLVDLVKVMPEFLKALAWIIVAAALVALTSAYLVSVSFTAFGVKDSPAFQEHREFVIQRFLDERNEFEEMEERGSN